MRFAPKLELQFGDLSVPGFRISSDLVRYHRSLDGRKAIRTTKQLDALTTRNFAPNHAECPAGYALEFVRRQI